MQTTTIEIEPGPAQELKLRRLIVLARWIGCDSEIWPAPHLGPGGRSFHAWIDSPRREAEELAEWQDEDPLLRDFDCHRYLFADDLEREAALVSLDP